MTDTATPTTEAQPAATSLAHIEDDALTAAAIRAAETGDDVDLAGLETPGETKPADAPAKAERPPNVPEKFWDAEKGAVRTDALLASYSELEKTRSAPKPEGEQPPVTDEAAQKAAGEAGLDFNAYADEYAKTGDLSKESREAIRKAGIPDTMLEGYIEGAKARAALAQQTFDNDVKDSIGGEKAFTEIASWAKDNLSAEDLTAYNAAVSSGDAARAKFALKSVKMQFDAKGEKLPALAQGRNSAGNAGAVYDNQEAMFADMGDPRYQNDAAFRAKVDAKIERTAL